MLFEGSWKEIQQKLAYRLILTYWMLNETINQPFLDYWTQASSPNFNEDVLADLS